MFNIQAFYSESKKMAILDKRESVLRRLRELGNQYDARRLNSPNALFFPDPQNDHEKICNLLFHNQSFSYVSQKLQNNLLIFAERHSVISQEVYDQTMKIIDSKKQLNRGQDRIRNVTEMYNKSKESYEERLRKNEENKDKSLEIRPLDDSGFLELEKQNLDLIKASVQSAYDSLDRNLDFYARSSLKGKTLSLKISKQGINQYKVLDNDLFHNTVFRFLFFQKYRALDFAVGGEDVQDWRPDQKKYNNQMTLLLKALRHEKAKVKRTELDDIMHSSFDKISESFLRNYERAFGTDNEFSNLVI